jgi:hypothetical protein
MTMILLWFDKERFLAALGMTVSFYCPSSPKLELLVIPSEVCAARNLSSIAGSGFAAEDTERRAQRARRRT